MNKEFHLFDHDSPYSQYSFYAKIGGLILTLIIIKLWCSGGSVKKRRDLTNQIVIITGANTGIGLETAKDLAKSGAKVILACRDEKRGKEATKIVNQLKPSSAEFMKLDLSDLTSVRMFVNEFKSKYNKLDILINNAGIMHIPTKVLTKDGLESQIGTNHFGHFLLTNLLLDSLKAAPQFRVINVSSRAHIRYTIDLDDLHFEKRPYNRYAAYSQSKIANILFTQELQNKFDAEKLNGKAFSVHPGVVRTEIARNWSPIIYNILLPIFKPLQFLILKSPEEGAQTTLFCAYEDFDQIKKGEYYADCKIKGASNKSITPENAEKLWKISEKAVKL